ncbi:hypothetical protein JHK86_031367 [Glycine max]|nr:hypothetical protein JHK86_031367 [Glycine max]
MGDAHERTHSHTSFVESLMVMKGSGRLISPRATKFTKREKVIQREGGMHERWSRNEGRITTFFFSKFPENYNEEDLWRVFKRWGKVWGIYIANRKDKWGNQYGFARFLNVINKRDLEKKLDQSYIGKVKLNVNIAKYGWVARNKRENQIRDQRNTGGNNTQNMDK